MIGYSEAQRAVIDSASRCPDTILSLAQLPGYTLAEDALAQIDVPPFDNSAMDGYAVVSADLRGAAVENPKSITCAETLFAGDDPDAVSGQAPAVRIMTGAAIPNGYDAVLKQEDVSQVSGSIIVTTSPEPGENVRYRASYTRKGDILLRAGHQINPFDIGILASCGVKSARVYHKPRVHLCVTGSELINAGEALPPGKIYDSNSPLLRALLEKYCGEMSVSERVEDNPEVLHDALASDADVVISCGGVSVGEKDYVPEVAKSHGWKCLFHKVAIKPGKPLFFARRGDQLFFGLPGNPLSATINTLLFVIPVLKKMAGRTDFAVQISPADLAGGGLRAKKRTEIWPGRISFGHERPKAKVPEFRSSGDLTSLREADGLVFSFTAEEVATGQPQFGFSSWQRLLT